MAAFSGFYETLDLLHQAMLVVLHHCTAMSIKMAHDEGAFVRLRRLFRLLLS
jgi:hypothetical protein